MARPKWLPAWLLNRRLLSAAALAGAVLLVLGMLFVLEGRSDTSLAAIQTTTTILLVFITGVYAYLTFRLVKLQENPPFIYRAAEQKAVSELLNILLGHPELLATDKILRSFPLEITDSTPPEWLKKGIGDCDALATALQGVAWQLPLRLQGFALASTIELLRATNAYLALLTTWERSAIQDPSGKVDPGALRQSYEQEFIIPSPPIHYPDWIELLRGDPIKATHNGLQMLRNELINYSLEQKGAKR